VSEFLISWNTNKKKINKRVPLVLTYHPSLENISGIVRHHWKEIEKSETLAKLFPEPPIVAFRRPKSIKDTLVRAAVSSTKILIIIKWTDISLDRQASSASVI
jgi:hypothetical protein